ncbi:MAG: AMP-binding protein [Candidatus Lambdaproteobacteria bacterium]|nr:AMP-binding protein [Candidatus Lambdaproteobacteria bacterium]
MIGAASGNGDAGTFPKLFLENVRKFGDKRTSIREKEYGIWQSYSWQEAWRYVSDFANGLAALGFQRGDRICVVGDNRPRLYWAMLSAQCLGGVPVPLYQDSIEKEMQFIVQHSEARFAVAEDQEQADKLIGIKPACPKLEFLTYEDPRGMRNYPQDYLLSYDRVCEMGRAFAQEHAGYLEQELAKGGPDDMAVICYTSGTTGTPKGVMLSHRNFSETSRHILQYEHLKQETVLAYLPMAWVGDFFLSFGLSIVGGFTVHCPEDAATVLHDLQEVAPTYFFAPPRIWENLLTNVMIRMDDAVKPKRQAFHYFIDLARRLQKKRARGGRVTLGERLLYRLGWALVYLPLRDRLGLRKVHIAYTAGEAIGPEILDFFRSVGINLKQLYGSTEASVFVALQRDGDLRSDTCGPPVPWVDLKISAAGEVLFKSPGLFQGYFKDEGATRETFEDGYFKTGDAGFIDHDGHLKIIDRVKDVTRLQDGTLFAPKYVENKLKFSPFIKEAVAIGQDRPYVTALVNIDMQAVGNWAERRNLAFTGYTDLAQRPEVYDLITDEVRRVNESLKEEEQLRGAVIRKYLILHKELDPDDEEITRTRKVRRRFIAEKYKDLINGLYGGASHVPVEAKVTFEDGRTATIKADLTIREVN